MRIVVQRAKGASVTINGNITAEFRRMWSGWSGRWLRCASSTMKTA